MKTRFRLALVILSGLFAALTVFCIRAARPPQWQARAAYAITGPEIPQALPELLSSGEFTGAFRISANTIPGTRLLELRCTDASPEAASAGLEEALALLPRLYGYLGLAAPHTELLHSTVAREADNGDTIKLCLLAGLSGAVISAMILYPPAESREPIALGDVLKGFFRRFRRRWAIGLALCILCAAGSFAQKLAAPPRWEVTALVSLDDADTGHAALAKTLAGLMASDLVPDNISAQPMAGSNLFCLTARDASPEQARASLEAFLADWPRLAALMTGEPEMKLLQAPFRPDTALSSPDIPGFAVGLGLYLAGCLLVSLEEQRQRAAKC